MSTTRLARASRLFHGLATASMVLLPLVISYAIFAPQGADFSFPAYENLPDTAWPVSVWAGIAVSIIPVVFMLFALNGMRKLFALYRLGDPLAPQAGPLIKSIGANLLLSVGSGIIVTPVRTGLMSLSNPPGERSISVGITTSDIGFVLVAGLLLMIGWSMSEAAKVVAENKEFI